MPSHDHTVEPQNLLLEPTQLSPKRCEAYAGYLRNSLVTWIGDDIEQFLDTFASDRSDDPELGKMGPDHIDQADITKSDRAV